MYRIIDWIRVLALPSNEDNFNNNNDYIAMASGPSDCQTLICRKRHAKYFLRCLDVLPQQLASHDSTRVSLAFFAICGLDVLNCLDLLSEQRRHEVCDWMYRYQVISDPKSSKQCSGFQGSSTINIFNENVDVSGNDDVHVCGSEKYKYGHLAMTYTGIAILLTLGDDLSRLNRRAIVDGVAAVQQPDGSFSATVEGNEHDMRFVFCASAICYMLDDWGKVDKQLMANYIKKSIRYDYGISQHLEMESHGGTTFCALAALYLSGQMDVLSDTVKDKMTRWLMFRQDGGFNGRPNKATDSCYSFWIPAAMRILDAFQYTDFALNREYILSTEDTRTGGFSKWPDSSPDPFHTYFSLCGLSFINEPGLNAVVPSLNISQRAYQRLCDLHDDWRREQSHTRLDIE